MDPPTSHGSLEPSVAEQYSRNRIPPNLISRFDPVYVEYYNKYNAGRPATHQIPIKEFRANPEKYTITHGRDQVSAEGLDNIDQKCPVKDGQITVRTITRSSAKSTKTPRPVYINFHGGGWVFGGLDTDFDFCKRIVQHLDCVAFDVDYRLAPEHPYPIPVEDCIAAFHWIRNEKKEEFGLDLSRVAIGGGSAGGHLSAVVAHVCRDQNIPLALQILLVPVIDLHVFTPDGELRPDVPYSSYIELAETQPLPLERMIYFHKSFLGCPRPAALEHEWKVSPILAPSFKNLAPALVITAEMDVLRDEGTLYAQKLKEAGCQVELVEFAGAPHTFAKLDAIMDTGKRYNEVALGALKKAFNL
ncbi:putative esterase [Xylogone sp. PMI_703]|nr:putative esterase [Xylogone sp. PMI_703]